jgi:Coenzyme PQQ synthesis protein D (PqqD)
VNDLLVTYSRAAALTRRVGREILVVLPGTAEIATLSETAADVWDLLERPCTLTQLSDVLAELYATPSVSIAGDVVAFLSEMRAKGLLETVDGSGQPVPN